MDYAVLLLVFGTVMGISVYRNWQTLYISKPFLLSTYFFLTLLFVAYLFPDVAVKAFTLSNLLVVVVVYVCALFIYALTHRFSKPPTTFIEKYGAKNVFIRLKYPFLLAKGFEIAFQQMCFSTFVLLLDLGGASLTLITFLGACALAVTHLPLLRTHGVRWGGLYVIGAFLFGLISPCLILYVPQGIAYAFTLHFLAYVVAGAFIWMTRNTKT